MATKTQASTLTWNAATVGEVDNISGLSSPSTKIDITTFSDTVMTYRPGRRKAGEFTFSGNLNPDNTTYTALETDRQAGTSRTVVLVAPSGTLDTITFTAQCVNITFNADNPDAVWRHEVTLKILTIPVRS